MEKIIFIIIIFIILILVQDLFEKPSAGDMHLSIEDNNGYIFTFNDGSKAIIYVSKFEKSQELLKDELSNLIDDNQEYVKKYFPNIPKKLINRLPNSDGANIRLKPIRVSAAFGIMDYSKGVFDTITSNLEECFEYPKAIPKTILSIYLAIQYAFIRVLYSFNNNNRNAFVITNNFDPKSLANKMGILNKGRSIIITPHTKEYTILDINNKVKR